MATYWSLPCGAKYQSIISVLFLAHDSNSVLVSSRLFSFPSGPRFSIKTGQRHTRAAGCHGSADCGRLSAFASSSYRFGKILHAHFPTVHCWISFLVVSIRLTLSTPPSVLCSPPTTKLALPPPGRSSYFVTLERGRVCMWARALPALGNIPLAWIFLLKYSKRQCCRCVFLLSSSVYLLLFIIFLSNLFFSFSFFSSLPSAVISLTLASIVYLPRPLKANSANRASAVFKKRPALLRGLI